MKTKEATLAILMIAATACGAAPIVETAREIPVAHTVDVVVAGGSTRAVAAAVAAKKAGASVFLMARRTYLGGDMCATYRLWLEKGEEPNSELAKSVYGDGVPTPAHVKRVLDETLLDARIDFLYGCYPTDVLRDDKGALAGVVMANRSGRQAVRAKAIEQVGENHERISKVLTDVPRALPLLKAAYGKATDADKKLRYAHVLPELVLARALYRCGDHKGLAKSILTEYAKDLRGHYATHAKAILEEVTK